MYKCYGPYNQYEPYEDVIYRLTCCYVYLRDNATYPRFNVFRNIESIHRSIDDAEKRIKSLVKDKDIKEYLWHSFNIIEIPIGVGCGYNREGQRWRTYDCNGEIVAESKASCLSDKKGNREIYWGREEAECRFKVGDIVEVICCDHVDVMSCFPAGTIPLDQSVINRLREVFDGHVVRIMGRISYLSMLRGKEDTCVKRMKAIMSKVTVTK